MRSVVGPALGIVVGLLFGLPLPGAAQDAGGRQEDERELRRLHEQVIRAHTENRLELLMSIEADDYVSVNAGRVTFPSREERRAQRTPYFENAAFSTYEDIREPVVTISDDGSLAWVVAEVRVEGALPGPDGSEETFEDVWAWVELYERTPEGWRLVGNVSNRRP